MELRIIAGIAKGRKLVSPPKNTPARPVTGRVRSSLFSILHPLLPGATVLDLFAGSGSSGIEALSRGASRCIFVEKNAQCCDTIRQNLELTGFAAQGKVLRDEVLFALERPGASAAECNIVFVDPPFKVINDDPEYVARLEEALRENLSPGALVVLRRETIKSNQPQALPNLTLDDRRVYGRNTLEFYKL